MPTLYTVTIDTEEEWDWTSGWPASGYSVANLREVPRFQDLCTRHGVATTYFVNHAVLADNAGRAVVCDLAARPRVEIGMHIHPWNTPPLNGAAPVTARESFLHNLPPDVIEAKLSTVYDGLVGLGLRPTSFRGGRYSCGPLVQQFLRDHAFLADASVLPLTTWKDDQAPDYRERDWLPVRQGPRWPGDVPLWEVPLTLGFTRRPAHFWRRWFERVERSWLSKLRLIGIAERTGLVARVWLNFEDPLGEHMLPFLKRLRSLDLPCICFTFHSSTLLAGHNVYTRTADDVVRFYDRMERVFATLAAWPEFRSATVTEVASQLEDDFHARARNQSA